MDWWVLACIDKTDPHLLSEGKKCTNDACLSPIRRVPIPSCTSLERLCELCGGLVGKCSFFAAFTFGSFSFLGLLGLGVRCLDWKIFGMAGKSERADEAGASMMDPRVDIDQRLRSARSGSYSSPSHVWRSYGSELRDDTESGAGLLSLCVTLGAPKSSKRLEGENGSEAPSKGEAGSSAWAHPNLGKQFPYQVGAMS